MRRIRWHKGVLVCLALGVLLAAGDASVAQEKGTIAKIKERGELRVGVAVYAPFVVRKPDGVYEGIDIELTRRLAESLGAKVSYVPQGWDTIVVGLAGGKFEVIPALCKTEDRAKVIDFSDGYFELAGVYAIRKDNPKQPKTLADMNNPNFTVVGPTGSWSERVARKHTPNAKMKWIPGGTREDILLEVLSGRADAYPVDVPVAASMIRAKYGDVIAFVPDEDNPFDPTPISYGLPKGDKEWVTYVNNFFSEQKKSGAMAALFRQWLGERAKPSK